MDAESGGRGRCYVGKKGDMLTQCDAIKGLYLALGGHVFAL